MTERKLPDGTILRDLRGQAELDDAVRLQEQTWGSGFTERVPAAILLVGQKIGGVSAGAFSPGGTLVGFVFGLTGLKSGRLVHWSDMLAVDPAARGRHLGEALKRYQRERCRAIGVETMYWTYDPFVARNAYLNLNRLGATIDQFVPDMYGTNTNSPMHGNLGTDRFVAAWAVSTDSVPMQSDAALVNGVPVAGGPPGSAPDSSQPLPDAKAVAVRIPNDYHALLARDIELARAWRMSARRAFVNYLDNGWHVSAFVPSPDGDATYLLTRQP